MNLALIAFEIRKFFAKKKNYVVIAILMVFNLIYIGLNLEIEADYMSYMNGTDITSRIEQLTTNITSLKDGKIDKRKDEIIKMYEEDLRLLQAKSKAVSEDNWKENLRIDILLGEKSIEEVKSGKVEPISNLEEVESELEQNKILLEKDIRPISLGTTMEGLNFLRTSLNDIMPVLIVIMIFILSGDIIAGDIEEGTYKILFLQPISRGKILNSKIVANIILCLGATLITFLIFFIGLGIMNGFGNPEYPVKALQIFDKNIGSLQEAMGFIPMIKVVLYALTLESALIIFMVCLSTLISTVVNSSGTATSIAITMSVGIYLINSQLGLFKGAMKFIPFSYIEASKVVSGQLALKYNDIGLNYINGVMVLSIGAIIFYLISLMYLSKKEIGNN